MSKARGRFDIVCVFEGGGYIRFTSKKERSLPAAEIAACLREYAGYIDAGVKAKQKKAAEEGRPSRGEV